MDGWVDGWVGGWFPWLEGWVGVWMYGCTFVLFVRSTLSALPLHSYRPCIILRYVGDVVALEKPLGEAATTDLKALTADIAEFEKVGPALGVGMWGEKEGGRRVRERERGEYGCGGGGSDYLMNASWTQCSLFPLTVGLLTARLPTVGLLTGLVERAPFH